MNIYEDYDDNTLSNHRPKAFLTFSEVDNEFLAANNFVALNLENLEESFIQASNNTAEINIDLGNYDLLENVIAERQNTPNSDAQETISKSNLYDDTFLLPPAAPIKRKKSKTVFTKKNTISKTFPCDLCDDTFTILSQLRQHKSSVHVLSALYKCEQCSKSFNFEKNFMLHLASHTSAAPARCPICAVSFQRISSFKGHLETHMDSDKFKCHRCDLEFEYEEYYERHLEKAHKRGGSGKMSSQAFVKKRNKDTLCSRKTGKYICKICGKRFAKPSLLLRHETAHTKVKPYECLECHQRFSQKSSLNRHSLVHNGTKPFDCPDCNLSFRQRTNLIVHINRVHSLDANAEDKFPCTKCSCVFNKLKSLNRHITLVHSRGGSEAGRRDCAEAENDDDDLFYINDVLNQIKCLQSDYIPPSSSPHHIISEDNSFATKTINQPSLDQPQTINSNVEDIPQMQYVNLVDNLYPSNERVNRLVKEVYIDGIKWLECLYCPKKFLKPFDIVRHIRVHTKEKPYQCQMCGRTFALKNTLTNHMRIHKRQLPEINKIYQCTVCLNRFDSLRRLDFHARQHRNYKPYACSVCFKPFGSSNCLRIHQQIHKPKNPEEEEIKRQLLPPIVACLDDKLSSTKDFPTSRSYQCAICGLKFQKSSHLKQHEDSHLGLKPFECLTCLRNFATKSSLVQHQKIHLGHKTKECEQCYAKFFTSGDLKRHKLIHSTARNFMCPYCKKTFKLKTTCKSHIATHIKDVISVASPNRTENPENNSDICNYILAGDDHNSADTIDSVNLNLPMQESDEFLYGDLERLLPQNCTTTTTTDESTQNLSQMTAYITTSKKRDHKTIRSSSKFINIRDLSNTENRLSKNIVVVSHEKNLEDSVSLPNSPIKNVQTEQQEEFLFQEARTKMAEKERKHVSRKKLPYVCEICKKIFKKPIDLKRHMRTHTKEKPFQCEICGKAFSLKCTMEDHRITHQKDRPTFDCQVCGKKYATKNVLNIHLRIHTGERPYSCEICSRTFRTPGHRIVHLRIHSKEKLEVAKKKKK